MMRITLEPTDKILTLVVEGGEVPARVWQGCTEDGTEVLAFVTRILAKEGKHDVERFRRELMETSPARPEVEIIPMRLIL